MSNVGVRSFPICALTTFLMGAILVLQSGEPLKRFGQIQEVPGAVALSLTREIAPRVVPVTRVVEDGATYYGPFPRVGALARTVREHGP